MGFEQLLPDYVGDAQHAYDQGKQRKDRQGLASLASGYYAQQGNDTLAQMASIDPGAAMTFQKQQDGDQDRQKQELGELAGYLLSVPEEQRAAVWQTQIAPRVEKLIPGAGQEQYGPHVAEIAQWAVEQYGHGGKGAAGVQSSFVDAQGRRMAIMRDGSVRELGQNAPNMQILEGQGGFYGVNKGNLQAAPVTMGQPQAAMPQQAPQQPGTRSVQFDFAPGTSPEVMAATRSYAGAEGPMQEVQGQPAPMAGAQLQPAQKPQTTPAANELERRVALARQMGASEDQIKAMVVGGGQTGNAQTVKTSQATNAKLAQFNTVQRGLDRLEKAAQSIAGNSVFDGGPIDQLALKFTPQGQELQQASAAIMPVLTALTRVPGVGAQSDLEARLAQLQMPSAEFPPEVNKRAVESLRGYMADLKAAYENLNKPAGQPAQAQGGWSIQAVP